MNIIADRCEVAGEVGSGGAGTVFSVVDRRSGAQLALKCLRSEKADARLATLFRREYVRTRRPASTADRG